MGQKQSNARACFVVLVANTTAVVIHLKAGFDAISVATTTTGLHLMVCQLFLCNHLMEVAATVRKASMLVSFR